MKKSPSGTCERPTRLFYGLKRERGQKPKRSKKRVVFIIGFPAGPLKGKGSKNTGKRRAGWMLGFSVFKRFCCFPCFWKLSVSKDTFARGESDFLSQQVIFYLLVPAWFCRFSCFLTLLAVAWKQEKWQNPLNTAFADSLALLDDFWYELMLDQVPSELSENNPLGPASQPTLFPTGANHTQEEVLLSLVVQESPHCSYVTSQIQVLSGIIWLSEMFLYTNNFISNRCQAHTCRISLLALLCRSPHTITSELNRSIRVHPGCTAKVPLDRPHQAAPD